MNAMSLRADTAAGAEPGAAGALRNQEVQFPDEQGWKNISSAAKHFLAQALAVDPAKRMRSSDALQHPWLRVKAGSSGGTRVRGGGSGAAAHIAAAGTMAAPASVLSPPASPAVQQAVSPDGVNNHRSNDSTRAPDSGQLHIGRLLHLTLNKAAAADLAASIAQGRAAELPSSHSAATGASSAAADAASSAAPAHSPLVLRSSTHEPLVLPAAGAAGPTSPLFLRQQQQQQQRQYATLPPHLGDPDEEQHDAAHQAGMHSSSEEEGDDKEAEQLAAAAVRAVSITPATVTSGLS